jgi:peptide subunit release factor 1 (eRF1)
MSTTERHPLHVNLRRLAELHGPDRAFVSIYLSGPESLSGLPDRMARIESLLDDQPDELEHFRRSMEMAQTWLAGHDVVEPGACVFACWALDFIEGHALPVKVEDRLRIDSSPFIWPLAEIFDEYESYVVIVADNSRARLLLVRTAVPSEEDTVRGDVKNRVKKGGWSQQRYARRREKQLEQYVKEIVDGLASLDEQHTFGRVILLGGKETLEAIEAQLPPALADKVVGRKGVDVTDADQSLVAEAHGLFVEQERADELRLLDRIRGEVLRSGLGAAGGDAVLVALQNGRADDVIVDRTTDLLVTRCRQCDNAVANRRDHCTRCKADDVFHAPLIEEVTRQAELTDATVEFSDPDDALTRLGAIAAHLRW